MISLPTFLRSFFGYMGMFGYSLVGLLTHILFVGLAVFVIGTIIREIWN